MSDYLGPVPVLSMSMVEQSIMRGKLHTNAERKTEAEKRLDYYNGDVEDHVKKLLDSQFSHPERMKLQPEWTNIVKPIINEVSMVYKAPASRKVMAGKGEHAESVQETYAALSQNMGARLKHVNRMVNLLNTVGVSVSWRNDALALDLVTPDVCNVVQDPQDPTKAAAVIIEQSFPDSIVASDERNPYASEGFYIVWTAGEHMVFNRKGQRLPQLANDAGVNPYGIIPIAWARDSAPQGKFWSDGSFDLINAQDMLAVKLTELNYLIKMQTVSIPFIKSFDPPTSVTVDPSNFIHIPLGVGDKPVGEFGFATPEPRIAELLDVIDKLVTRVAWAWGLSPEQFKLVGAPASGFALKLQNIRLLERREDDVENYRTFEMELFTVMRTVWNAHNTGKQIPEDSTLAVNFGEVNFPEDPAVEDAHWQILVSAGVANRAEWMMSRDPDLKDEAAAIKRLAHNDEINQQTESAAAKERRDALAKALGGGMGGKARDKDGAKPGEKFGGKE